MKTRRTDNGFRGTIVAVLATALTLTAGGLLAIQTQEVDLGLNGAYDGTVMITRDPAGRLLLRDQEVTTPTALSALLEARFNYIEQLGTLGALGTAPLGDGLGRLVMTDVATQTELDAKAARSTTIGAGAGLTGGGDLSANRALALDYTATLAGDPALNAGEARFGAAGLLFEGSVADAFEGLLTPANPTADRTWTLPDVGGTVAISAATPVMAPTFGQGTAISGAGGGFVDYLAVSNTALLGNGGTRISVNTPNGSGFMAMYGTSAPGYLVDSFGLLSANAASTHVGSNGFLFFFTNNNYSNMTNNMLLGASGQWLLNTAAQTGSARAVILDAANPQLALVQTDGAQYTTMRTDGGGDLTVTPSGGDVTLNGNLALAATAGARLTLNGSRLMNEINLFDNPDFGLWQRNTTMTAAAGGDADGTLTHPVPGTLTLGADRWQASRSRTGMTAAVGRATPPAGLATALDAMKIEAIAGAPCRFYVHQTLTRERTAGLRGKWVTFAVSVYETGAGGGNIALYKTVGGSPTELARYTFASTADGWDRVAVTAQVPADAETLLASVQPELSTAGPTTAYLANATLVEGRYVAANERMTDPALSSVPPLPRDPAANLAACQRFYEKGSLGFTAFAPDSAACSHSTTVHFNTAKADATTITLGNLSPGPLTNVNTSIEVRPAYDAGTSWPQGFRLTVTGASATAAPFAVSADWTAECAEPI